MTYLRRQPNECSTGVGGPLSKALSVADIERRHLRDKRILSSGQVGVANYTAQCILEDQRSLSVASARAANEIFHAQGMLEDLAPRELVVGSSTIAAHEVAPQTKSLCAFRLFTDDKKKECGVGGGSKRDLFFTKEGRKSLKDGFAALPDA